jgi:hypothetical protein
MVWIRKKTPPKRISPPASHNPQVLRSALSSTVRPSQINRMVLKSETAITAEFNTQFSVIRYYLVVNAC